MRKEKETKQNNTEQEQREKEMRLAQDITYKFNTARTAKKTKYTDTWQNV